MSRIRSVAAVPALNRRTLLAATGAVSLSAGIGLALRPDSAAHAATPGQAPVADSLAHNGAGASGVSPLAPAELAPYTRGTTLRGVAAPAPAPPATGGWATAPAGSGWYATSWPPPSRAGPTAAPRSPRSCSSPTCT